MKGRFTAMREMIKNAFQHGLREAATSLKWVVFSVLSGILIGSAATFFSFGLSFVTLVREKNPWIIWLLPIGGLLIVGAYRLLRDEKDTGTNLVLSAIHSGDELPFRMAPLIFFSTLITHLFGGSAGREGAALQLGGSIGNGLGQLFHFDEKDKHIMIMCGMSAAFSALFGTPMAAAIFSMEVVSVGIMHYSALVPCEKDKHIMIMCGMSAAFSALFGTPMAAAIFSMEVVSVGIMHYSALVPCVLASLTAHGVALFFGVAPERFLLESIPAFTVKSAVIVSVLAVLCALVSVLYCILLHQTEHFSKKLFKNAYVRIFIGGLLVALLTFLVGSQTYNGAGMPFIEACMETGAVAWQAFLLKMLFTAITLGAGYKGGEIVPTFFVGASFGCLFASFTGFSPAWQAFLLKMLFTAITLGAGYKGGEIVPTFFVGASFGCLFASFTGFSPMLCTAVGMTAVFCGVTNCPLTSLLISFELFGFEGMPYFLLAVAFSYMLSGYYGLYQSQKIVYSKYKTNYINRKTH